MNIAKTRVITPLFDYNERSRNGATNTIPAPDIRPAYTGANAMAKSKPVPSLTPQQQDGFWSRVEVHQPAGCWEWSGSLGTRGYGQYSIWPHISLIAHRVAYSILIGPIPVGMTLDHLCRNRRCVNPDHLQAVSSRVNNLRGYGPMARNARKTHCQNGHEFTPENILYTKLGYRACRACLRSRRVTRISETGERMAS